MEQRTLNIINICKGNTKYFKFSDEICVLDAIKQYMAEECAYQPEWYKDKDMFDIMYDAMLDYLDTCDSPRELMYSLKRVYFDNYNDYTFEYTLSRMIAIVFSALQVFDHYGYINGFDERLHLLDRPDLYD